MKLLSIHVQFLLMPEICLVKFFSKGWAKYVLSENGFFYVSGKGLHIRSGESKI